MRTGGPLRIAAWPIWSGRERSSHSHLPQVPQIRLANLPPFPIRLFFTLPTLLFASIVAFSIVHFGIVLILIAHQNES